MTVENIFMFAEYDYTPRGRPAASDAFAVDPLAEFEIVDDAGATVDGPSAWSYDPTTESVQQTSKMEAATRQSFHAR